MDAADRAGGWRASLSVPWAVAACAMALFIWGNSLVPGDDSAGLSLAVLAALRHALDACGLPSAWLTNFLVRKAAHFTEYAVLAVLVCNALGARRGSLRRVIVPLALVLVLVPCVDEGIQLFVEGRSGQLSDVMLDCCGGASGALLRCLLTKPNHSGLASNNRLT